MTWIEPVRAPAGTVARISESDTTENVVAATPPKRTSVVPVKRTPLIVTTRPGAPAVGVNDWTSGLVGLGPPPLKPPCHVILFRSRVVVMMGL
jgi:hypothetical protein